MQNAISFYSVAVTLPSSAGALALTSDITAGVSGYAHNSSNASFCIEEISFSDKCMLKIIHPKNISAAPSSDQTITYSVPFTSTMTLRAFTNNMYFSSGGTQGVSMGSTATCLLGGYTAGSSHGGSSVNSMVSSATSCVVPAYTYFAIVVGSVA